MNSHLQADPEPAPDDFTGVHVVHVESSVLAIGLGYRQASLLGSFLSCGSNVTKYEHLQSKTGGKR